jgi:hypothetical protein
MNVSFLDDQPEGFTQHRRHLLDHLPAKLQWILRGHRLRQRQEGA